MLTDVSVMHLPDFPSSKPRRSHSPQYVQFMICLSLDH